MSDTEPSPNVIDRAMYQEIRLLASLLLLAQLNICTSIDTIIPNRAIKDGDVLVSRGEAFALGFFSPGNSGNRYVGIWYNNVSEQTVVWVANRDNPIKDTSGVLSVDRTGNLVLNSQNRTISLWSTNVSSADAAAKNTGSASARLLDSGNLVLFQDDAEKVVAWQSFDNPTHTMLAYMKLGVDRRTGLNRFLTSWKSQDDPGTGEYSYRIDLTGKPQLSLYKGRVPLWRAGPWDGMKWSGVPEMTPNFIFNVSYVENEDEVSVMWGLHNASIFSRMVANESGVVQRLTWNEGDRRWIGFWSAPKEQCDYYDHCGSFGDCDPYDHADEFECRCLPGYEPKSNRDWYLRDGSKGCMRKHGGQVCGNGEGFVKVAGAKVPDTSAARVDKSLGMGLQGCQQLCIKNCFCTGYTIANISGAGSGCITWYGDLIDTRQFSSGGQDLYIRVDAAELAQYSKKSKRSAHDKLVEAIAVVCVAAVLLIMLSFVYWRVMKRRKGMRIQSKLPFGFTANSTSYESSPREKEIDESQANADLLFFHLSAISAATDNFSDANKLGEGGFGSVYKGRLLSGQEIAVKRLSQTSGQGVEEFKNEVTLIAKLQHRNLVRLLGCCIQKEEKILIYEYLPNRGLDYFIFDKAKGSTLDWKIRFDIILGVVRALIYLHQDSRLRIIHRDLKASNVLLDAAMKPKISDFGMARIFGGDQMEANTGRIVGTYGYMSPEYAMEGLFSVKSDVFSFGILLLEIISGRKNGSYYQENSVNLIGHVWHMWREGKALDVVDSSLGTDSYEAHEVLRCIHIGLLCVQEFASDRPAMPDVAFMLSNETALPAPSQPAFVFNRARKAAYSTSASAGANSVDDATISILEAR